MPVWWVEIRTNFSAWLSLALLTAPFVFGAWFWTAKKRSLFPPQRTRFVPWSGFEVCLVFLYTMLLVPAFVNELLNKTGFFNWLYGPGFDSLPGAADQDLSNVRRFLWISVFAFPFQLLGTIFLLRALSGTRLYQLGLTTRDALRNALTGWLAWLLVTPPVLLLHVLVVWTCWFWEGFPPEEHSLARLARGQPSPMEWILIVVSGVVVAPILEELLFRRVLQGWSAGRPWGAPITLAVAFVLTVGIWLDKIRSTWNELTLNRALHDLEPVVFVLILIPGCFLGERLFRRWLPQPYAARAIYSSALLFAMFHVNVWPTPVPLFVLGLGLGYVAYRTQSLIGPIVMHALFNGVACVVMLLTYAGPVNGKATTSADRRPASVSASSIVPGWWLPRRT